jgi:hypothetical protein
MTNKCLSHQKVHSGKFGLIMYQDIKPLSNEEWQVIHERCYHAEASIIPIAVSLHKGDALLAERLCLSLATHEDVNVRGNAILGFGHLARRFRKFHHGETIKQIVEDALRDSDNFVCGQAVSAADDIEFFLHWKLNRLL